MTETYLHCVPADCSSSKHSTFGGLVDPEICAGRCKGCVPDRHFHIQAPGQVATSPWFPACLVVPAQPPGPWPLLLLSQRMRCQGMADPESATLPPGCVFLLMKCILLQDEGVSGELHSRCPDAQGGA